MKKMLKRISIFLLMITMVIGLIYKPGVVHAEDEKLFVIPMPSNEISMLSFVKGLTVREYSVAFAMYSEYASEVDGVGFVWKNSDDKNVLIQHMGEDDEGYFELYEGATEEDCVFDITDELKTSVFSEYKLRPLDGYDKIKFVFQEFDSLIIDDSSLILDYSNVDDVNNLPALDYLIFNALLPYEYLGDYYHFYQDVERDGYEAEVCKNMNDEVLYEINSDTMETVFTKQFTFSDNLTIDISQNNSAKNVLSSSGFRQRGLDLTGIETLHVIFKKPDVDLENSTLDYDIASGEPLVFEFEVAEGQSNNIVENWDGSVFINHKEIEDYEITEGSVIFTIDPEDVEDFLVSGNNTFRAIDSNLGFDAETTFVVDETEETPQTGDQLYIYLSLLAVSIGGLFAIRKLRKCY